MQDYKAGTILEMKKTHPCGSNAWEVLSSGYEYTLKCRGCGHVILMKRDMVNKFTVNAKNI